MESVGTPLHWAGFIAFVLALLPGYRVTAMLNVLASLLTLLSAVSLLFVRPEIGRLLFVDDLNVVFIVADDLGWGELGCYGQKKIPTPNIDRLATQGTRFTQHYSGAPVCAPSRCVLMTGKHLGHAEIRGSTRASIPCPPSWGSSVTSAPRARSCATRAPVWAAVAIGSWRPLDTSTRVPVRSTGGGSSRNGTIAASSTAPASASGRRNSVAEAMFAPFEKPTADQLPGSTP